MLIKSFYRISLLLTAISSFAVFAEDVDANNTEVEKLDVVSLDNATSTFEVATSGNSSDKVIPCPFGWSVQPNPSVDNSLSYVEAQTKLAISVTSIKQKKTALASPQAYARVASEQMNCETPVVSNLIEDAWSFECKKDQVEAIVYGSSSELVLLVISGRNAKTEPKIDEFMRFLAFEAEKKN